MRRDRLLFTSNGQKRTSNCTSNIENYVISMCHIVNQTTSYAKTYQNLMGTISCRAIALSNKNKNRTGRS